MRKKSAEAIEFINSLHNFLVRDLQFRDDTTKKTEAEIQSELRPVIVRYLENYFTKRGHKTPQAKAHASFYWEGQEGSYRGKRTKVFGSRQYPDFIITAPYRLAIEYKQGPNGSLVKHGIAQSIMHTLSGDFDFVYLLFHDESKQKVIEASVDGDVEKLTIERMRNDFNVFIRFAVRNRRKGTTK